MHFFETSQIDREIRQTTLYCQKQKMTLMLSSSTKFVDVHKLIFLVIRVHPTTLRLFLPNGLELKETDLQFVKKHCKIYATLHGEDLNIDVLLQDYEILGRISQHIQYGLMKSKQQQVAIKTIHDGQDILTQCQKLHEIDHPSLPKIYNCILFKKQAILIMEFIEGKTLFQILEEYKTVNQLKAKSIIKQVCECVSLLHSNNLLLKNINLQNIIITSFDSCSIKLLNVGLFQNKINETLLFCSPEQLTKQIYQSSSDIWSIGVTLYIMLFGRNPFERSSKDETALSIVQGLYYIPKRTNSELSDLFNKIFILKFERRIDAQQILEHPWLSNKVQQIKINWRLRFNQQLTNNVQPSTQKLKSLSTRKESQESATMKSSFNGTFYNRNMKLHSLVRSRAQSQICLQIN